jgi:PAS domain S-box-containing protein
MSDSQNMKALLVEDSSVDAKVVEGLLKRGGSEKFCVEHVTTLAEALRKLDGEEFAVVILDLGLPDAQGLETLRRLRAHCASVPVMVLTGTEGEEIGIEAMQNGAQDYIPKSQMQPLLLRRSIRYAIERHKATRISEEDMEKRIRAEASLHFHENLLRETGHIAKVGGWEFEVATGKGYWTEEVARIHELAPETQPTKEMGLQFYEKKSRPRIEKALVEALEHGTPYDLELELKTVKGNHRWVRTIAHPVLENGKVVRIRGSFQDITERRMAEDTLRRQASLIEQAYDAVVVWEREGAITYWNRGAEKIYGFSKEEAIGRISHELLKSSFHASLEKTLESLTKQGSWEGEVRHTRKDGQDIVVESRMVQIIQDEKTYVLETNRDMSEKRMLEEQFRQAQKMEAIGQLAGGVAHDFNNLLGVILGTTELLEGMEDWRKAKGGLEEIRKAGKQAANLTRQLLAFSRKQVLEPKVVDLDAKVAALTEMLKRIVGENVEIRTSFSSGPWKARVDPSQVEQILLNLVVNARDAMPKGGKITIETRMVEIDAEYAKSHSTARPGRYVMIAVSDSGEGMSAETQARIFEPFFTTKKSGTGLGLSMVYGAVQQSGGNIWVYSELGKGTTFKAYFPAIDAPTNARESSGTEELAGPKGQTILLVEDSESLREVTKQFLMLAGFVVKEACNGVEALRIARLQTEPIQLMLTDVVMPGMSGPELAKQMKVVHPEARVLFMSGYTPDAIVHHGMLDEGISLLPKPFSRAGLTRKVNEILSS